jgi:hypothetical protein
MAFGSNKNMKQQNSGGHCTDAKLCIQDMIMINIDQLHHLKISWYSYMCFFSHFDLIPHQWQMMAFGSNKNKQQQNSGGH